MRIAFVGIKKDWELLRQEDYLDFFIKYHLELPWYYAKYGENTVDIFTENEFRGEWGFLFGTGGSIALFDGSDFASDLKYDVVVHWRRWFPQFYDPHAINVINSQDHSYSREWKESVYNAIDDGKLWGILCFPTWHEQHLQKELQIRTIPGLTLGVDTDIYKPAEKHPFKLLWASDPGRGLWNAVPIINELYRRDRRYRLHVCWPDYVANPGMYDSLRMHPAIVFHKNLKNGPELWDLFNTSAFLPYASQFKEPSSRAHRQAQAAGQIVLYPPDMGSPSYLIQDGFDGVVCSPDKWAEIIEEISVDWYPGETPGISENARKLALSENWEVQAHRFNKYFEHVRGHGK